MPSTPDTAYKYRLESIADKHLSPDAGQAVDVHLREHIRNRILSWIRGPEILETGAGEGTWTSEIIESFGHTSIVDGSARLLAAAARKYGERVTCYESFFEEFKPPVLFNTVVATYILEHVHDPVRVLVQARSWLVRGGRVVILVPNATSLHRRLGVLMGDLPNVYAFSPRDYEVGHQRVYDIATLTNDVRKAGYRIVEQRGFLLKILSVGMMSTWPDKLIKACVDLGDELPIEMTADIAMLIEPEL